MKKGEFIIEIDKKGNTQSFPELITHPNPETVNLCRLSEYYWLVFLSSVMLNIFSPHIYKGQTTDGHTFQALLKGDRIGVQSTEFQQILGRDVIDTGEYTYLVTQSTQPRFIGSILSHYSDNHLYGRMISDTKFVEEKKKQKSKKLQLIEAALLSSGITVPQKYTPGIMFALLRKVDEKLTQVQV